MTFRTRDAVSMSSSPLPLSTRETVVLLTPARAATSAIVIGTAVTSSVVVRALGTLHLGSRDSERSGP